MRLRPATAIAAVAAALLTHLGAAAAALDEPPASVGAPGHAATRAGSPDLAVTAVRRVPREAAPRARLTAQAVVANRGTARSPRTPVELVLSRDTRRSADDVVAARDVVAPMAGGARATRTITGRVPATATGRYRVIVCLAPKKPPRTPAERRNDCSSSTVLSVHPVEPDTELPWVTAHLTGDLELRQSGHTTSNGRDRTWDRWGDLEISFAAEAPSRKPELAEFSDDASRYSWSGADTYTDGVEECEFWWEELEDGSGPFADGRLTARFVPGTGTKTIEISLTMGYHVNGSSGADCRADHTWAEDRTHTTVLVLDLLDADNDHALYGPPVRPPAGSLWDSVTGTLELTFERRPL